MLNLIIYQHNPNHIPVDHLANAKKNIFLKPVFFNVIFQPLNDTRTKWKFRNHIPSDDFSTIEKVKGV